MSTGSVYQRKDGKWCAALQVAGKRKVVYGRNKGEARRKLARLLHQCATVGRLPDPGRRTVATLLDQWLGVAVFRPRTHRDYRALSSRYIRPVFGHIRLARLEPVHLQQLYTDLLGRGFARVPSQVHRLLHRALKVAVLWGWLPTNPADRVVPPGYAAPRRSVWTADELRRFLDATTGHRLHPLWVTLCGTGMRISEISGLTWLNVDLDAGTVDVQRALHRLKGQWVATEPKTKAGRRIIKLPPDAVAAFRHQRVQQNAWRLAIGPRWHDSGLVFTSTTGRPLGHATIGITLRAACARAGVPRITCHGFRHGHASLLFSRGTPVPTISARLGHASPDVTVRVYAHALGGDDERAAQAIGDILAGDRG